MMTREQFLTIRTGDYIREARSRTWRKVLEAHPCKWDHTGRPHHPDCSGTRYLTLAKIRFPAWTPGPTTAISIGDRRRFDLVARPKRAALEGRHE